MQKYFTQHSYFKTFNVSKKLKRSYNNNYKIKNYKKNYYTSHTPILNFGNNFFTQEDFEQIMLKLKKTSSRKMYKKFFAKILKFKLPKIQFSNFLQIFKKNIIKKNKKQMINSFFYKRKIEKNILLTPKPLLTVFKKKSANYFQFNSSINFFNLQGLKKKKLSRYLQKFFLKHFMKNQFTITSYILKKNVFINKNNKNAKKKIFLRMFYNIPERRIGFLRRIKKLINTKKFRLNKALNKNVNFYNRLLRLKLSKNIYKKLFFKRFFYYNKKVLKDKVLKNNIYRYLRINNESNISKMLLKSNTPVKNKLYNTIYSNIFKNKQVTTEQLLFKNVISDFFNTSFWDNYCKKLYKKNFYQKLFYRKYFYTRSLWRVTKPKSSSSVHSLKLFFKSKAFNNNTYLKSFPLKLKKNSFIFRKAVHYKEFQRIERLLIAKKVSFSKRKSFVKKIVQSRFPWYRQKFFFSFVKSKKITLSNKKTKFSYFYPVLKRFEIRPLVNRYKHIIRINRSLFWKKSWDQTKLSKKQYFSKLFLRRSLSRGHFKKQDSFRLLHNFRTIFLKYNYKTSKNCLTYFKKLKNHSFIENYGNNFLERFLWQLERSLNILMYRSKYIPHIKISNHLIRYGFVMINNKIVHNPYTQINLFDIARIAKLKYFKRIFLTQFINLFRIRKRHSIPSFIETNKKILALSVYRKPKIKDFVTKKTTIVFGPDKNFYNSLPIIASLF